MPGHRFDTDESRRRYEVAATCYACTYEKHKFVSVRDRT